MSNKRTLSPLTIGSAVRLPPIPFKRVFKDKNRYSRRGKYRDQGGE